MQVGNVGNLPEMAGISPFKEMPSPFTHGVVVAVDVNYWTVTIEVHETGTRHYNVPIMSPYFYRERGQGAYFIPEVGAQCLVCNAYGQYFVLGFLPPVQPYADKGAVPDDLSQPAGTTSAPSKKKPVVTSYRNSRDGDMLPGDYCFMTRAKNRLKIFTNGNILLEASKLCYRIYSKLKSWTIDYCVNYTMNTPGGQINFTNAESGLVDYKREIRKNTDDPAYSFVEKIGTEGNISYRAVNMEGVPAFTEQINPDGSVEITSMTGGHKVTMDPTQIKIETSIAGINSITLTATGIVIQSDTTVDIQAGQTVNMTSPGGTLNMTAGGATWGVIGNLTITSTGNTIINPVGALILAP